MRPVCNFYGATIYLGVDSKYPFEYLLIEYENSSGVYNLRDNVFEESTLEGTLEEEIKMWAEEYRDEIEQNIQTGDFKQIPMYQKREY